MPNYAGIRPDVDAAGDAIGAPLAARVRVAKLPPLRAIGRMVGQVYSAPADQRPGIWRAAEAKVLELELAAAAGRHALDAARGQLPASGDPGPVDDELTDDELDALTRPESGEGGDETEEIDPDADADAE